MVVVVADMVKTVITEPSMAVELVADRVKVLLLQLDCRVWPHNSTLLYSRGVLAQH